MVYWLFKYKVVKTAFCIRKLHNFTPIEVSKPAAASLAGGGGGGGGSLFWDGGHPLSSSFTIYLFIFFVALCLQVSLVSHVELAIHQAFSLPCDRHTHAHTCTHAHSDQEICLPVAGNSLPSAEALASTSSTKCSRVKVVEHQGTRSYAGQYYTFARRGASHN